MRKGVKERPDDVEACVAAGAGDTGEGPDGAFSDMVRLRREESSAGGMSGASEEGLEGTELGRGMKIYKCWA